MPSLKVPGGRAPSFHDLSVGETAAPPICKSGGDCGGGRTPPQISSRKDQPESLGTEEKVSSLIMSCIFVLLVI